VALMSDRAYRLVSWLLDIVYDRLTRR